MLGYRTTRHAHTLVISSILLASACMSKPKTKIVAQSVTVSDKESDTDSSTETKQPTIVEPAIQSVRSTIVWNEVEAKVFKAHCNGCHSLGNKLGVSNFTDLEIVKSTIGTILYYVIVGNAMPPPPSDLAEGEVNPMQLTRDEKDLLSQWVVDGMKSE